MTPIYQTLSLAVLFVCTLVGGAEASPSQATEAEADGGWRFEATAQGWLPVIEGTVDLGEMDVPIDLDLGNTFDLLGNGEMGGGAGGLSAHSPALGLTLFVDAFGMAVRDDEQRPNKSADGPFGDYDTGDLDVHQSLTVVEFGLGYRAREWRLPGAERGTVWIEPFVGARHLHYDADVNHDLGKVHLHAWMSDGAFDPLLGVRWHVDLTRDIALEMRGDIGGFGVGTQLSWGLESTFRYRIPWTVRGATFAFLAGYKVFDFDWHHASGYVYPFSGPNPQSGAIDLNLRGPLLGFGAQF